MATAAVSRKQWDRCSGAEHQRKSRAGKSVGRDHRDAGTRRGAREGVVSMAPPLHLLPVLRLAEPPCVLRQVVQRFPQALASPLKKGTRNSLSVRTSVRSRLENRIFRDCQRRKRIETRNKRPLETEDLRSENGLKCFRFG